MNRVVGVGTSLVLIAAGAIMAFAISVQVDLKRPDRISTEHSPGDKAILGRIACRRMRHLWLLRYVSTLFR